MLDLSKTVFSVLEHGRNLLTRDAREPFQELVNGGASLKILEQSTHGHTRTFENPRATDLIFMPFDFRAIGPIQHPEHDMLRTFDGQGFAKTSMMPSKIDTRCTVNDQPQTFNVYPMERLLDVLREQLHLTGTKEGCGEGECGACTVLIDGQIVNSCLVPVAQIEGCEIKTIEGIAINETQLHAVQQAFIECGGAQCGICTPGMVIAAVSLLNQNPNPTDADIRDGLAGNLCRCTGYMKIFESVVRACEKQ